MRRDSLYRPRKASAHEIAMHSAGELEPRGIPYLLSASSTEHENVEW